jgi:hypothetical protein
MQTYKNRLLHRHRDRGSETALVDEDSETERLGDSCNEKRQTDGGRIRLLF